MGYEPGLQKKSDYYAIKMPVFSFEKIRGADISLGPEMKSTGECLGISKISMRHFTKHSRVQEYVFQSISRLL